MQYIAVFQSLKPAIKFLEQKTASLFRFLNNHYTPLAVVALTVLGSIFFFITSFLLRYNHWNYWLWKKRAITKSIYFGIILLILKILIGVM